MKIPEWQEDRSQVFPTQVKYDEKYDVLSVTFAHSDNTYGDDNYGHGLMVWRDIESDKALGFRISGISKYIYGIESEINALKALNAKLENAFNALAAELAAAKADLKGECKACTHKEEPPDDCDFECLDCKCPCICAGCRDGDRWEWRGAPEE